MQKTKHLEQRMSQRGINKKMIDIAYEYGRVVGDKFILDRKEIQKVLNTFTQLIVNIKNTGTATVILEGNTLNIEGKHINVLLNKLNDIRRVLIKIMDKGGITLVECDNVAITAYNNYK